MSLNKNKYFFEVRLLLVAFMFACSLWYIVVGNAHIESDIVVRLEYRSLPANLAISDNIIKSVNVRMRASSEVFHRLESRDLFYPIDLSTMKSGANVVPIEIDKMIDFKSFDILNVDPAYVVVEIDTITTKTIPIQVDFIAMKNDDLQISNVSISPTVVEIQGPSTLLRDLEYLFIPFDLNKVEKEEHYSRPLQVLVSEHLVVNTPVVTLSFDVVAEKKQVEIRRSVSLENIPAKYKVHPKNISLILDVPPSKVRDGVLDSAFSSQIRVVATGYPDITAGDNISVQVILPENMKLLEMNPSVVTLEFN